MATVNSSNCQARGQAVRPPKPRPDFPLYPHKYGKWAKKVRGRVYYFTKWTDDPKGKVALGEWLEVKDDLMAGRVPRADADALTVADLCNCFLTHKRNLRETGEIGPRTFREWYDTCEIVVKFFGKTRAVTSLTPQDFGPLRSKLAKTRGVLALRNQMQRVRGIFKYAFDEDLILRPVRFGQSFARPKLDAVRRARESQRRERGDRMFEAREIREMLKGKYIVENADWTRFVAGAPLQLRAMILLGINGGLGQSDLAALPLHALDLDSGWLNYPRPKTAVGRKVPLWEETIAAIREWLVNRPEPKDPLNKNLVFVTAYGTRWVRVTANGIAFDSLSRKFTHLLKRLRIYRKGVSFYALRHSFETIAGETGDQIAVDAVMGHVPQGMGAQYRERIADERLMVVTEHVRRWLWPAGVRGSDPVNPADPTSPAPPAEE